MKLLAYLLLFSLSISNTFGQNPKVLLEEGAVILAKQSYKDGKKYKSMRLITFALELNNDNLEAQDFIETIKTDKKIRVYQKLPDNGRKYSEYAVEIMNTLPLEDTEKRTKRDGSLET